MTTRFLIAAILAITLSSCAQYQSHVAARTIGVSGYAKDNGYGGQISDRVEYR